MCCHVCSHCRSFFFSSRRRHTRFSRDWSSDVCSSDLIYFQVVLLKAIVAKLYYFFISDNFIRFNLELLTYILLTLSKKDMFSKRSEERRVGKECRSRGWSDR